MMKIAIPTNDMVTISSHFGRSKGFLIVELKNNQIEKKEYVINTFTAHVKNKNNHDEHGNHNHSHQGIFNALGNSHVVIAKGMGHRLFNEFSENDIKVYITKETNIDNAVKLLVQGKLKPNKELCCEH